MLKHVGNCPKCGAPIYIEEQFNNTDPPAPYYTCTCNSKVEFEITDKSIYTINMTTGKEQ